MGKWTDNIQTVDRITLLDAITEINNVTSVDLVDEITEVANVSSVDLVDEVTEVANVTSVDTVDLVTQVAQGNIYAWDSTNEQWTKLRLDKSTSTIQTIDYAHHENHAGNTYRAIRSDTLATNDTIIIAITTPDTTKEQHLQWDCYGAGAIKLEMFRNVTSYTGGTAYTPVNMNDRSSNTSVCTVKVGSNGALADGIALTGGTAFELTQLGSGSRSGGDAGARNEWILARNEITALKLTAIGNNIVCSLHVHWYEHTPHA